jgi:hypothetical protein
LGGLEPDPARQKFEVPVNTVVTPTSLVSIKPNRRRGAGPILWQLDEAMSYID